ncbi:phosphatase PAP2 family protein [Nocardia sp. NPDC006044]|uniref:phosphatase PAP2 family protein n=1 Tax=Nocardia sp. NPDC006044 TaxID=3364306 RepID=UPI0036B688AB
MSLDPNLLRWLSQHRAPTLVTLAGWAMDIGANAAVIAAVGVIGLVLIITKRWWWQGFTVGAAVVAATALATVAKQIIRRARPSTDLAVVEIGGWSMPSTVAAMTAAAAVATYLVLPWAPRFRRWIAAVLTLIVALIGSAMVYLGAHWPTDVLVGWILGTGVSVAVVHLARIALRQYRSR